MQTSNILRYFFVVCLFFPHYVQSLLQKRSSGEDKKEISQYKHAVRNLKKRRPRRKSKRIRRKRLFAKPSTRPSIISSIAPSNIPTMSPSKLTSRTPSTIPTSSLSSSPSTLPSLVTSLVPSIGASLMPSFDPSVQPSTKPSTSSVSQVPSNPPIDHPKLALGHFHSCVIDTSNGLKCWGFNTFGQLGDGTTTNHITPTTISIGEESAKATIISLGFAHTCAIDNLNRLKCWGNNGKGQLGDGTVMNRHKPFQISLGTDSSFAIEVVLGAFHTCIIDNLNNLKCWGFNAFGQLGDGTNTNRNTPTTPVCSLGKDSSYVTQISVGLAHTCAIDNLNDLKCWGRNDYGQIGNNVVENQSTPTAIYLGGESPNARKTVLGFIHSCTIDDLSVLKCWGDNSKGQLGDGTTTNHSVPKSISPGIEDVALGSSHTCTADSFGILKCWGDNREGQLGIGTEEQERHTPTPISLGVGTSTVAVAAGNIHTCAIDNLNNLKCWGDNSFGQLGDGTELDRDSPTLILKL